MGLILVAQAAAATAADPPDIELRARVSARSVDIRSSGEARLTLHADPGEAPPVRVERSAPAGRKSYRNLTIDLHGFARLTAPAPITAINAAADRNTDTSTGDIE